MRIDAIPYPLMVALLFRVIRAAWAHGDCDLIRQITLPGQERRSFVSTGIIHVMDIGGAAMGMDYSFHDLLPLTNYSLGMLSHGDITDALDMIAVDGSKIALQNTSDPAQGDLLARTDDFVSDAQGDAEGRLTLTFATMGLHIGRALVLLQRHTIISACIIGYDVDDDTRFQEQLADAQKWPKAALAGVVVGSVAGLVLGALLGGFGVWLLLNRKHLKKSERQAFSGGLSCAGPLSEQEIGKAGLELPPASLHS
eukprot:jgi/Botrbrau1/21591/Bobra.43_1s0001.1